MVMLHWKEEEESRKLVNLKLNILRDVAAATTTVQWPSAFPKKPCDALNSLQEHSNQYKIKWIKTIKLFFGLIHLSTLHSSTSTDCGGRTFLSPPEVTQRNLNELNNTFNSANLYQVPQNPAFICRHKKTTHRSSGDFLKRFSSWMRMNNAEKVFYSYQYFYV